MNSLDICVIPLMQVWGTTVLSDPPFLLKGQWTEMSMMKCWKFMFSRQIEAEKGPTFYQQDEAFRSTSAIACVKQLDKRFGDRWIGKDFTNLDFWGEASQKRWAYSEKKSAMTTILLLLWRPSPQACWQTTWKEVDYGTDYNRVYF